MNVKCGYGEWNSNISSCFIVGSLVNIMANKVLNDRKVSTSHQRKQSPPQYTFNICTKHKYIQQYHTVFVLIIVYKVGRYLS